MAFGKFLKDITGTTFAENVFSGKAFKSPSFPGAPDISSELARIDAIINQAREQAKISLNREAALSRSRLTGRLAGQGVLDSPASGLSFEALEGARLSALASTDAGLLSRGAELRAGLMSQRAGQEYQARLSQYQQRAQRQAALISGIAGLGASYFLGPMGGAGAASALQFFSPNFKAGEQAQIPYYLQNPGSSYDTGVPKYQGVYSFDRGFFGR